MCPKALCFLNSLFWLEFYVPGALLLLFVVVVVVVVCVCVGGGACDSVCV